jgi:hypothetical protein
MRVAILPSGALRADRPPGDDEASDGPSVAARTRALAHGPGYACSIWARASSIQTMSGRSAQPAVGSE